MLFHTYGIYEIYIFRQLFRNNFIYKTQYFYSSSFIYLIRWLDFISTFFLCKINYRCFVLWILTFWEFCSTYIFVSMICYKILYLIFRNFGKHCCVFTCMWICKVKKSIDFPHFRERDYISLFVRPLLPPGCLENSENTGWRKPAKKEYILYNSI